MDQTRDELIGELDEAASMANSAAESFAWHGLAEAIKAGRIPWEDAKSMPPCGDLGSVEKPAAPESDAECPHIIPTTSAPGDGGDCSLQHLGPCGLGGELHAECHHHKWAEKCPIRALAKWQGVATKALEEWKRRTETAEAARDAAQAEAARQKADAEAW